MLPTGLTPFIVLASLLLGGASFSALAQETGGLGAAAPSQPGPAAEPPASPPPPPPPDLAAALQPVAEARAAIEAASETIERVKTQDEALAEQRGAVERIGTRTRDAREALVPKFDAVRAQIAKLGDPPAKEAPPESQQVAEERNRLQSQRAEIDGAIRTADVVQERARQLTRRIQDLRQGLFAGEVLQRTRWHPLQPAVWRDVWDELPGAALRIAAIARSWWIVAEPRARDLAALLIGVLILYFVLRALRRWFVRRRLSGPHDPEPSFFDRAAVGGILAPAIAAPSAAAALALYGGLDAQGLLLWQVREFAWVLLSAVLLFVGVAALARAILQPGRPAWRLLDLSDASARRLYGIARAVALVYALDTLFAALIEILYLPLQVSIAQAFVASVAIAVLLLLLIRTPFNPKIAADTPVSRWRPRWLKIPLLLAGLAILGAALGGYVALARFMATQVVLTGSVVVLAVLLHLAIRQFAAHWAAAPPPDAGTKAWLYSLDATQRAFVARSFEGALNLALLLAAVPLVLLTWNFSLADTFGYVRAALFGFEVGQFRISLVRIVVAIALFLALLFVTRFLQRWLSATVLKAPRVDTGLANSISTGVGYAGFGLAALVAVSYSGFDISSFAIVAGALSVGIGFGLQSIVNNFVSGLILLAERPVKVGDLIVVRGSEGYVRRISVRATEIETFDRSTLIVPNSELITGAIVNWTHRNSLGRVVIRVTVHYRSDPDQVRDILTSIAAKSSLIVKYPAPTVSLDNLGPNGPEYSLRVFLADVNRGLGVESELRTAILKEFRAAGVQVPYPPHDGHLGEVPPADGRVVVTIAVVQSADPEAVRGCLASAAEACRELVHEPPAIVSFDAISENGFAFSVRGVAANAVTTHEAESVLRMAAVTALRGAGIELARPQTDVRLRDLDPVRALLVRLAEEKARQARTVSGAPDENGSV